ncbi:aminopeptidase, putative (plasmid) [Sinorhizobium fredii HH103]|uniref:Aminopeptidase, putative n=1 Tax=Sinorhizobium fredii (strain HH103) TaxID=1117943 RepID=G9ABT6_SINF1|nr:M28 family metallopeptidase [Sinorhizobium fredii]CCE98515.1 aminopeptidase, putative [Sinorhizobium fredii HH103]
MAPVRLATCAIPPGWTAPRSARTATAALGGASSLQFGDQIVYLGTEGEWAGVTRSANRAGLQLGERPGSLESERLHVVIQKGRLFQREHPDVPVLVDKGRYLLVDLDPVLARRLAKRKDPCFSVLAPEAVDKAARGMDRVVFASRDSGADRAASRAPDPVVQMHVDRISRATFELDLAELVALPTRFSSSAHYQAACDIVEQKLASFGYATSRQTIGLGGSQSTNVVARRVGTGPATRRAVLVTAHLDSINLEGPATAPAPGADDDGSGSAGVIEIARALKDVANVHDLVFIHFGGEEQGLFGSKHFVRSLSAAQRSRVHAVVNMDMIGALNTPAPTVLLEGRTVSQPVLDGLAEAASRYTGLTVETSVNAANSDHVSFLDKGMPAVLTIEGADSTNDEIHTSRDTLDRINFDLALEILRMNTAFVAEALATSPTEV